MTVNQLANGPAANSVRYNGIVISHPVTRIAESQVQYSQSGRTMVAIRILISVTGWVFQDTQIDKTANKAFYLRELLVPGKVFEYYERGGLIFGALPVDPASSPKSPILGYYEDVDFGPKPVSVNEISQWPNAAQIRFILAVTWSPARQSTELQVSKDLPSGNPQTPVFPADAMGQPVVVVGATPHYNSPVLDHTVSVTYSTDVNHMTSRVVDGELAIIGKYGNFKDHGVDAWRQWVLNNSYFMARGIFRPPEGFQRTQMVFSPDASGRRLIYRIVDEQRTGLPLYPASDMDVSVVISDEAMQVGSIYKIVSGYFVLPPGPPGAANIGGQSEMSLEIGFTAVMRQIWAEYVVTDPEALVWVEKTTIGRQSYNRGIRYDFEIRCVHVRSLLYKDGFAKIGLFQLKAQIQKLYNYSLPYGTAGLGGDGYNLDKVNLARTLKDPVVTENITKTITDLGLTGESIEANIVANSEKTHVFFRTRSGMLPKGASGAKGANNVSTPTMFIAVVGWKSKLCKSDDPKDLPMKVTAGTYFNLMADGQLTGDAAHDVTAKDAAGNDLLPAVLIQDDGGDSVGIPSKINNTRLVTTKYSFVVMVSPLVAQRYIEAYGTATGTMDTTKTRFSQSLDGNKRVSEQKIFSDPGPQGSSDPGYNTGTPSNTTPPAPTPAP